MRMLCMQQDLLTWESLCTWGERRTWEALWGPVLSPDIPGKAQDVVEAGRKDAFVQAVINRLAGVTPCASVQVQVSGT